MTSDTARLLLSKIMEKRSDDSVLFNSKDPAYNNSPFANSKGLYGAVTSWLPNLLRTTLRAPTNVGQGLLNIGSSLVTPTPGQTELAKQDAARIDARHAIGENALLQQLAMLGLGAGGAVGGIYALNQAMKPRKKDLDTDVDLPYPVAREKMAAPDDTSWLQYFLGTQPQKPSLLDNPLFVPTAGATALAALYGGYKGSSYLADALLQRQQKNELTSAKDDFQKALLESHDQPLTHDPVRRKKVKTASMEDVGHEIDVLFDLVEKRAKDEPLGWSSGNLMSDIVKAITPAYTTYALVGGVGTGALAYDMTRKHSRAEALKKALRERARMKYEISPPELNVIADAIDPDELKKNRPSSVV